MLKNFIEEVEEIEDRNDVSYRIIKFINEYASYFNEIHTLNFFKFNNIRELDLVLGPGMYYFRVQIQQRELLDYGKKKFELNISDDENWFQNSLGSYENLERDFSELKDLWYDKFGYRINSIISTVQVLGTQLNERYSAFFEPYEFNVPVFEIQDLKNKKIKDIREILDQLEKCRNDATVSCIMQSVEDGTFYDTKALRTEIEGESVLIVVMEIDDDGITVKLLRDGLEIYEDHMSVFVRENRMRTTNLSYEVIGVENNDNIVLLKLPQRMANLYKQ